MRVWIKSDHIRHWSSMVQCQRHDLVLHCVTMLQRDMRLCPTITFFYWDVTRAKMSHLDLTEWKGWKSNTLPSCAQRWHPWRKSKVKSFNERHFKAHNFCWTKINEHILSKMSNVMLTCELLKCLKHVTSGQSHDTSFPVFQIPSKTTLTISWFQLQMFYSKKIHTFKMK